jgi:hypothetical protein
MNSRASSLRRLSLRLSLGLLLLLGLCLGLGLTVRPAFASKIITVSPCDQSHLSGAITEANKDNAGDTIKFNCGGSADIKLTSTLTITGNMTIYGSDLRCQSQPHAHRSYDSQWQGLSFQ